MNHAYRFFRPRCYRHTRRGWQRVAESNHVAPSDASLFSKQLPTIECYSLKLAEDPGVEPSHAVRRVAVFKTVECRHSPSSMAEEEGFEPPRPFQVGLALAKRHNAGLCHSSTNLYVPYFTGIRREFSRLARGVAPRPERIIGRVAGRVTALWTHVTRLDLAGHEGFEPPPHRFGDEHAP